MVVQQPPSLDEKRRWVWLGAVLVVGVLLAVLILLRGAVPKIDGRTLTRIIASVFAFVVISLAARSLVSKTRRRIFLTGWLPFFLGLAKICGFVACLTLILALIAGLIAGPPFAGLTLGALIVGLVGYGVMSLVANGLLNLIIVVRHFRGTLTGTTSEMSR